MRAKRTDANHADIIAALRRVGCAVVSLHEVGKGVPDLLVWARNRTLLMEVKVPGETINKQQAEFIASWPGEIHVVRTEEEALKAAIGDY